MRRLSVFLFTGLAFASLCFGWGEEGHRIVIRIAEGYLTPEARAAVQATLDPGESLENLGSWADVIRRTRKETAPWHFVDIPLHSTGLDMARDCPKGECVIGKIEEFRKKWRDPAASHESRREALLFLAHFVGDLHQPLHSSNNGDEGGNLVPVSFLGGDTKLHALWDSGLLGAMPSEEELLPKLQQAITPDKTTAWSLGTPEQWAEEAWHAAQTAVYGPLPPIPADQPVELDRGYEQMAEPVIEEQLEKAGVRLAAVLNER